MSDRLPAPPRPRWAHRFTRLSVTEYWEKWRGKVASLPARLEPVDASARHSAYTFERLAFDTRGGLKLLLVLFPIMAMTMFVISFWWNPYEVVRACSIAGLIGFGTNWIAVKMLFRPRHPRPIFGQGLIPSQRSEILRKIAEEITEKLVNEEKIREEIEDRELVSRVTGEMLEGLRRVVREPEFVDDTRAVIMTIASELVESQEFRQRVAEATESRVREVAGRSVTTWLLDKARELWFGPLHRIVDRELDVLPDTIDTLLRELDLMIGRLPAVMHERREMIERNLTRVVMAFVREVDLRAMLDKTLDTVTPEQLEQSFHEFADDKLSYITLLGGILGTIGGLIIVWPLLSLIALAGLALALALLDLALYPLMTSRLWPRKERR